MITEIEKFASFIENALEGYNPTVIVYGSSTSGECRSDIDACIITDSELAAEEKKRIIDKTIGFYVEENLKIDNEVPFENKLLFSAAEANRYSMQSPFEKPDGTYVIDDIQKTVAFLSSEKMRHRLWLNLITTEHVVLCGDKQFVDCCEDFAWKQLIQSVFCAFPESREYSVNDFLSILLKNPHSGAIGEDYLGYKTTTPKKEMHLRQKVREYLPIVKSRKINARENLNPFSPTPLMIADLIRFTSSVGMYPQCYDESLRNAAAQIFSLTSDNVIFTHGAMEGIQLAMIGRTDGYIIPQPAFWGYKHTARNLGIPFSTCTMEYDTFDEQLSSLCKTNTGVILCNTNNPFPIRLPRNTILEIARENTHCHIIVDETMLAFHQGFLQETLIPFVKNIPNLTVIISLSKITGLCALRCGFLFGHADYIRQQKKYRVSYGTNTVTQQFLQKHLSDIFIDRDACVSISDSFSLLTRRLSCANRIKQIVNNGTAFILVEFSGDISADCVRDYLAERGILVSVPNDTYPEMSQSTIRISAVTKSDALVIGDAILSWLQKEGYNNEN